MKNDNLSSFRPSVGYVSMLAYIVITAISTIVINDIEQRINPIIAIFYSFLMGALFFNIVNFKHTKSDGALINL